MDRLTARNQKGIAYLAKVDQHEQEIESHYPNTLTCILECFQRLAAYEDIDMLPEEIKEVQEALSPIPFGRFYEIMTAERDGRCVVLSTPMVSLVKSDDEMDTDVYCPACNWSVSGGWEDYHTDQEWKMCQCPHCGQSIDDTKVITIAEAEAALGEEEG